MIEMFIGNRQLNLPKDIQIRIELNSPAFETDGIPASVVHYFDLPISLNEDIFKYANHIAVSGKRQQYEWRMYYNGIPLFNGKLILKQINNKFRCAAIPRDLPDDFPEKSLQEFAYPDIRFPNISMSEYIRMNRISSPGILMFPKIYTPALYGEDNQSNTDFRHIVNPDVPLENDDGNYHSVIPLFSSKYILDFIFNENGYRVFYPANTPFVHDLLLFNNYTLDRGPVNYHVFSNMTGYHANGSVSLPATDDKYNCVINNSYMSPALGDYQVDMFLEGQFLMGKIGERIRVEIIMYYSSKSGSPDYSRVFADNDFDYIPGSKFVFCEFSDLFSFYDSLPVMRFECRMTVGGRIIQNDFIIVSAGHINVVRTSGGEIVDKNGYAKQIIVKNHLPPVSVHDFLLSYKQMFGLICFFEGSSGEVELFFCKDLLSSRSYDLTNNCIQSSANVEIGDVRDFRLKYDLEEKDIAGYDFVGTFESVSNAPAPRIEKQLIKVLNVNSLFESKLVDNRLGWVRLCDSYKPYETGENKKEDVDIKAHPMPMTVFNGTVYPYYDEQGVSPFFLPDTQPTDKLIYMKRVSADTATSANTLASGKIDPDGLSFSLDGSNGIYETLLKDWYDFLSGANEYTFDFKVDLLDMLQMIRLFRPQVESFKPKYRRVRIDNQIYIPKQLTFELTHDKIKCQAKLMKNDRDK